MDKEVTGVEEEVEALKLDLADRKTYIGGSDAPIIVGASKWKTRYQLWREKTGKDEGANLDEIEYIMAGKLLEPVIADLYSWKFGVRLRRINERKVSGNSPYPMVAQIDRKVEGKQTIVEIKNSGFGREFGEEDTDAVPLQYWVQVQHQLAVAGWDDAELAALVGGNRLKRYFIRRDPDYIDLLMEAEYSFWKLVESDTPPAATTLDDAALMWPRSTETVIQATEADLVLITSYLSHNERIKELEAERDATKLQIEGLLQSADTLVIGGKTVATWKSQSREKIDTKQLEHDHPEIVAPYKGTSEFRVLRVKG